MQGWRWAFAAGLVLLPFACGDSDVVDHGAGDGASTDRPTHVLLITVDTLRADRLSSYGAPRPLMPRVDALAARGTRFERAMAPMPQTSPSHASMFTGQYPLGHGLTNNMNQMGLGVSTLAELFRDHGFRTAGFFHQFPFDQARLAQGFDFFQHDTTRDGAEVADAVQRFLASSEHGEPFFLWAHTYLPHAPVEAPDAYRDRWVTSTYDGPLGQDYATLHAIRRGAIEAPEAYFAHYRDQYDAEVAFADHEVGRILDALSEAGVLNDTLILFTADHGEALEDGVVGLHSPLLTPSTLHVPLLMAGPGVPRGAVVAETVELIDVFATLLEPFEIPAPEVVPSQSLWPLARGEAEEWDDVAFSTLPSEYLGREDDAGKDATAAAVRRGDRLLVQEGRDALTLYALDGEPRRLPPGAEPDTEAALHERLANWLRSTPRGTRRGQVDPHTRRLLEALGYAEPGGGDPPSR